MRDNLIELLKQCTCHYSLSCNGECEKCHLVEMYDDGIEYVADHLLSSGVGQVRHGEWELHKDGSGTCSECHFTQKNVWDFDNWQNFCGHCGAKMDRARGEK